MDDTNQNTEPEKELDATPDVPPVEKSAKPEGQKYSLINKLKLNRKVIPAILGVFFLVGAIAAGVVLVQQEQELREGAIRIPCN